MKTICKKSLVISIIFLLIGVSISSAVSVNTKSTIADNESEECRECKEVSKSDLIRVERLLDRVEVYSKLLLVLSRDNPEIKEISEELSNKISTITNLNLSKVVICLVLSVVLHYLLFTVFFLYALIYKFYYTNPELSSILISLFNQIRELYTYYSDLYDDKYDCVKVFPHHKSHNK